MKGLRTRFNRFCYKHRNKGIPNLMLYVSIGNAIVYVLSLIYDYSTIFNALCFDKSLILQGQVWRLFSCVFVSVLSYDNIVFVAISLVCFFSLGRAVENTWGTFRFNLYYLCGILLMDIFAMLFSDIPFQMNGETCVLHPSYYANMGAHLNLSLLLVYSTLYPDTHFLFLFIIPVKAWIFALIDIVMVAYSVFILSYPNWLFPHNLYPILGIANYLLFVGKDVRNLIPVSWRLNTRRLFRKGSKDQKAKSAPIPFAGSYQASTATVKAPFRHQCVICKRTDVSNPELEFRYCSRCNGYHCYCQDHIQNHTHIE